MKLKQFEIYHVQCVHEHWIKKQQPLNKPLMPPIFLTIWANFVYCVSNSCTSLVATPDPRATRWMRLGCLLKSLAPSLLSSSEMKNHNMLTDPV